LSIIFQRGWLKPPSSHERSMKNRLSDVKHVKSHSLWTPQDTTLHER
jgi:hypothetical protein